jgi:hypothetical protein
MNAQFTYRELNIIADVCHNLPAHDYLNGFRQGYRLLNPFTIRFSSDGFGYYLTVTEEGNQRTFKTERIPDSEWEERGEGEDEDILSHEIVNPHWSLEWVLADTFADAARQFILESVVHTTAKPEHIHPDLLNDHHPDLD